MEIPPQLQHIVELTGAEQWPGESDDAFFRRLVGLERHTILLRKAKRLGADVKFAATSVDVRTAIRNRIYALLKENGVVVGAEVLVWGGTLRVDRIFETHVTGGLAVEIRVGYYRLAPWDSPDNRGRANHALATSFLSGLNQPAKNPPPGSD